MSLPLLTSPVAPFHPAHRKGVRKEDPKTKAPINYDLEDRINFAVFPGLQVGIVLLGAAVLLAGSAARNILRQCSMNVLGRGTETERL
jgi:hypothetical protein